MREVPKVYVSSESLVKHAGIKRAFARLGLQVDIIGFAVESGVAAQPLSIQATHAGAQHRHETLRNLVGLDAEYLVTNESGVVKPFPSANWKGCEVVIVQRQRDGRCMTGIDLGVEYPQALIDKIPNEYPDLGVLLQVEYGFTEKDPPSYLTNGKLSRTDLIEQAVVKVLAQMEA